jgi:ribosomal protein L20
MTDRYVKDNRRVIRIRARTDWIARLGAAAKAAGENYIAYIRRALEARLAREDHTSTRQPG